MRMNIKNIPLFAMLAFLYVIPTVLAQEQPPSASTEASNALPKEKSIYSKASDAQLKEAQKYYGICTGNDTLSDLKDCKCAATKYLETRLELGNTATTKEIISINTDTCLKNPKKKTTGKLNKSYSDIPQVYLEEANDVYEYCVNNQAFSINFDCKCYASKFLSMRQEEGSKMGRTTIMANLKDSCRNVVGTTGQQYTSCMSIPVDIGMGEAITQKDYCECYAYEWARLYKNFKGNIDSRTVQRELGFSASMRCTDPSMYNNK
ncbi:MAG: hypothetical protein ACRBDI_08355 [Alphaproteobacteria bacterium]